MQPHVRLFATVYEQGVYRACTIAWADRQSTFRGSLIAWISFSRQLKITADSQTSTLGV